MPAHLSDWQHWGSKCWVGGSLPSIKEVEEFPRRWGLLFSEYQSVVYQVIMVESPACRHGCRETNQTQLDQPRERLVAPQIRIFLNFVLSFWTIQAIFLRIKNHRSALKRLHSHWQYQSFIFLIYNIHIWRNMKALKFNTFTTFVQSQYIDFPHWVTCGGRWMLLNDSASIWHQWYVTKAGMAILPAVQPNSSFTGSSLAIVGNLLS